jgi:hypothetical protein
MKKIIATIALLAATITPALADQVLIDKQHKNFKACAIVNGVALADLKAKGFKGEVLVNSNPAYIAKVSANGASILLMCEGGRQIGTLVK